MDAYQREIFSFLTKRDAFNSLIKAMEHYEGVRKELLTQFWLAVEAKLRALTATDNTWAVELDGNIFGGYSKLRLYKTQWKLDGKHLPFALVWEGLTDKPYYGLLFYMDTNNKDVRIARMREAAATIAVPPGFEPHNRYWPFYMYANLNFSTPHALLDILPDSRDALAQEWALSLFNLASKLEKELDALVT